MAGSIPAARASMVRIQIETDMAKVIGAAITRMVTYAREESQSDASHAAIPIIQGRTAMGFDQNGRVFLPYTERYERRRRKAGKRVWPVDLYWLGDMLHSLHFDKAKGGVTVDDNQVGKARGAQFADGPYNRAPRPFMGLRKADAEKVKKALIEKLRKAIMQR